MKYLLLTLLLCTPAIATPTEVDYCAYIVPELEQAVKDEVLTQSEVDSILERCYKVLA